MAACLKWIWTDAAPELTKITIGKPMKQTLKLLAAAALIALPAITAEAQDFGNLRFFAKDNKVLSTPPAKGEKRVVFFGNSITECWWLRYNDFFQRPGYIARGIGGQTTYHFLYRFRSDVIDIHASLVVICAGGNDIAENSCPYNEDVTFGNIESMVEIARANNVKVILTSLLPTARYGWSKAQNVPDKIRSLNRRLEAYAKEKKIPYVNYYDALVDADGISLKPIYTDDGVHPVKVGYEVMEKLVVPVIEKTLKK